MAKPGQKVHDSSRLDIGDLEKLLPTSQSETDNSEYCCSCDVKKKVSYSQQRSGDVSNHVWLTTNNIALWLSLVMSICALGGVLCLYRQVYNLRNDNAFLIQKIKDCATLKRLETDVDSTPNLYGTAGSEHNVVIQDKEEDSSLLPRITKERNENNDAEGFLRNIQNIFGKYNTSESDRPGRVKRSKSESNDRGKKRNRKGKGRKKGKRQKKPTTSAIHLESKDKTEFDGEKFKEWHLVNSLPNSEYEYDKGDVTVFKEGVYFIYSQVTYYTEYPNVSFGVYIKRTDSEQPTCAMKCINAVDVNGTAGKRHQHCYSAKAVYLKAEDKVFISDVHGRTDFYNDENDVMVDFSPELTFWGIIKMN